MKITTKFRQLFSPAIEMDHNPSSQFAPCIYSGMKRMTWSFTCKLTHTKRSLLVCVSLHVNDQVISPQPSATDLLITLNLPEYSQIPILILKFTHGWLHIGDIVYIRH